MRDRCEVPRCRDGEAAIEYLGKGVCQKHWDRYTGAEQQDGALRKVLGLPPDQTGDTAMGKSKKAKKGENMENDPEIDNTQDHAPEIGVEDDGSGDPGASDTVEEDGEFDQSAAEDEVRSHGDAPEDTAAAPDTASQEDEMASKTPKAPKTKNRKSANPKSAKPKAPKAAKGTKAPREKKNKDATRTFAVRVTTAQLDSYHAAAKRAGGKATSAAVAVLDAWANGDTAAFKKLTAGK